MHQINRPRCPIHIARKKVQLGEVAILASKAFSIKNCTIFPFFGHCAVPPYLNFGWCINEVSDPQNMKMICKDLFWPQSCTSQKSKADDENHTMGYIIWYEKSLFFVEIYLIRLSKVQEKFASGVKQRFLFTFHILQQW